MTYRGLNEIAFIYMFLGLECTQQKLWLELRICFIFFTTCLLLQVGRRCDEL